LQKTVTDITEWTARDGKVYQSALFDCYDNMCLGLPLRDTMHAELCIDTYKQASKNYNLQGVIAHSDRGSQYTSEIFRNAIAKLGVIQSMNSAAGP
jgi:transposase InsO family protein